MLERSGGLLDRRREDLVGVGLEREGGDEGNSVDGRSADSGSRSGSASGSDQEEEEEEEGSEEEKEAWLSDEEADEEEEEDGESHASFRYSTRLTLRTRADRLRTSFLFFTRTPPERRLSLSDLLFSLRPQPRLDLLGSSRTLSLNTCRSRRILSRIQGRRRRCRVQPYKRRSHCRGGSASRTRDGGSRGRGTGGR